VVATVRASARVPRSNGAIANTPIGPLALATERTR
jgi:hypothetical protein